MPRPPLAFASTLSAALAAALVLAGATRAEDAVIVNITGPLAGKVGDRVAYDVEIINNAGRDLPKLRVVDYFDAGFHHEASKSPIEQKGTIDLPANTKRWIKLELGLCRGKKDPDKREALKRRTADEEARRMIARHR